MDNLSAESFLEVLQGKIRENREVRGYLSRLSEAAGIHPSYLSRALQGTVFLTLDQVANLAAWWGCSEIETQYVLSLGIRDRAGSKALREWSAQETRRIREKASKLSSQMKSARVVEEEDLSLYYSSWVYSAVHVALLIPGLRSEVALAKRFRLPKERVAGVLQALAAMGLARKNGAAWVCGEKDLHLPNDSPWSPIHHQNWRVRAMAEIARGGDSQYHFTGVYSLSREQWNKVQRKLKAFIAETHAEIRDSKDEELGVFTIDSFVLGGGEIT